MSYSHDDIAELLGAYALDALDTDETDLVEAHLPTCPRCKSEVSEHREVAAMLAHSGAPAPEGLWQRIQSSLEEPPPALAISLQATEPAPVRLDERRQRSSRWRVPAAMAVAAALVLVGLFVGVLAFGGDTAPNDETPVAAPTLAEVARRAFNDPLASKVTLTSATSEVTASVAIEPDGTGYLLATSLPSLDNEHTYQLWGITGDVVVSLGVFGRSPEVVVFTTDLPVDALAVTREVAGGVVASANQPLVAGEVS